MSPRGGEWRWAELSRKALWKVGIAQLACAVGETHRNVERAEEALQKARREGCDLLMLPEVFLTGLPPAGEIERVAEPLDGPSVTRLAHAAGREGVAVTVPFVESAHERGCRELYNTLALVDQRGGVVGSYRKTHLFMEENELVRPGDRLATLPLEGVECGLMICYDVEFPEVARALAYRGAALLLVSSANMYPYDRIHRVAITARAIENHAWVVYCNRAGRYGRYRYVGESAAVDPFGAVVADAGAGETFVAAQIDLGLCGESRKDFDYLRERRPELYDD